MSGTRIFIKNLASRTTEQDINEIFGKFGEVTKIDLKTGFGFIFYAHADDADEAIKSMNDREVDGKVITVEMARDEKKKPVKRLDLRVSVSGMGSGVSWQDLKDWAREAGDVTFTNCFMRDGQNCGVVEFQDNEGMENGLRILETIPLKGSLVRLEKDATAFDSRSNGRRDDAPRYVPRNHEDDRSVGRPFDDRDPRGGGYRGDPRGFDSRGPYPGGDRDRDRGYPPHGGHIPPPHHFDGPPPRGYDDRGEHRGGPYGGDMRGRYSEDYRRGPPMGGPPPGYYPPRDPHHGRSRSRSRERGGDPRGGAGYWPADYRGAGPPGGGFPPRSYSDAPPDRRGGYDGPSRGAPPSGARYYEGGRGGPGYDSRGPPR